MYIYNCNLKVLPYITDIIPEDQLPLYISISSAATVSAHIVGPFIGAGFSYYGLSVPFFICSALCFIGLICVICWLHESHPKFRANAASSYMTNTGSCTSACTSDNESAILKKDDEHMIEDEKNGDNKELRIVKESTKKVILHLFSTSIMFLKTNYLYFSDSMCSLVDMHHIFYCKYVIISVYIYFVRNCKIQFKYH